MKLLKISLIIFSFFVFTPSFSQTATYSEVINKEKKGNITMYVSKKGEAFSIGDTLTLGVAFRNEQFDFIQQNAGIAFYPLENTASGSKVIIKKIKIQNKLVILNTTKAHGLVYGLLVINLEAAIENGEIKMNRMSSDEALKELKRQKDKLELGLISEEEFAIKKAELIKFID